jgi:hypothetical protein
MGNLQAQEFAELVDLDTALHWHARSNHYPPLPTTLVPVWKEVIKWVNGGNDSSKEFKLPAGITYRGYFVAPAWVIIEKHHLGAWIVDENE